MTALDSILIIIISLTILVLASQFTIKTIEKFMELTKMAEGSAGFIILSVMSSFPEIMVAIFAVIEGEPAVSIGDIFGSHLFNLAIVLGGLAIFGHVKKCRKETLEETVDFIFLITFIPLSIIIFENFQIVSIGKQILGFGLIFIYIFVFYSLSKKRQIDISQNLCSEQIVKESLEFSHSRESKVQITENDKKETNSCQDPKITIGQKRIILLKILLGGATVILSSRFTVSAAIELLEVFNIVALVIGAKLIAIGTSLPELIFCYYAAKRKKVALALGDLFGANLTTITIVLGIILIAAPFAVNLLDFIEMIFFLLIVNIIIWRGLSKGGLSRNEGILLLGIYVVFQLLL